MRCQDCGTVWHSRIAGLILERPALARCPSCHGRLIAADAQAPGPGRHHLDAPPGEDRPAAV